jgi:hypothetical protein
MIKPGKKMESSTSVNIKSLFLKNKTCVSGNKVVEIHSENDDDVNVESNAMKNALSPSIITEISGGNTDCDKLTKCSNCDFTAQDTSGISSTPNEDF